MSGISGVRGQGPGVGSQRSVCGHQATRDDPRRSPGGRRREEAGILFLASESPRRKHLLREMGIRFKAIPARIDESVPPRVVPLRFALETARRKAEAVARLVCEGVVLGVDTIVVLNGRILGKPEDRNDARRMLRSLSGRTHQVISGVCLLRCPGSRCRSAAETTRVRFRKLSPAEIEAYLDTPEPYDKAGAYGIQGRAGLFVERIEGDYNNVVGLPAALLYRLLVRARLSA